MIAIVLGLGFGDEGKGLTTSYLCSQLGNMDGRAAGKMSVIRFNGGHQAGHTVVHNGIRHVFSSFGSGTLQGVPTYLSKYCTIFPTAFINEYKELKSKGITPTLYADPLCPITTPYDMAANRKREASCVINPGGYGHGSVGVGFGETIQRQEDNYKLFLQDLYYPKILKAKLNNIANYYGIYKDEFKDIDPELFLEEAKDTANIICESSEVPTSVGLPGSHNLIFEGAQGILLDKDYGFFPNVTRSNTTCKNAIEMIPSSSSEYEIFYVIRTYQTRHGNGFMTNEPIALINNENETNKTHEYQGEFRKRILDPELLNYALKCDDNHHRNSIGYKKNLVITCMDQNPIDVDELLNRLDVKFDSVFISKGDTINTIEKIK